MGFGKRGDSTNGHIVASRILLPYLYQQQQQQRFMRENGFGGGIIRSGEGLQHHRAHELLIVTHPSSQAGILVPINNRAYEWR